MTGVAAAMRALVVSNYGELSSISVGEVPVPAVGPGEVLIRTGACALNFPDLLMIEGKYQVKPPLPFVPGRDVAGEIVAVGPDVLNLSVGQRVAAQPAFGAFAEYVAAPAYCCLALPDAVGDIEAAASGTVLATVVGALKLRGRIQPGEWVLITGAAGGVGSAGIQYARFLGAEVVALVSSAAKEAVARRLGARIILRSDLLGAGKTALRDALHAEGLDGVEVVVDMVGGDDVDGLLRCLKPGGRFVIVGFASGRIPAFPANYLLLKDLAVYGSSLDRLFKSGDAALRNGLREAFGALAAGQLAAEIEAVLPFSDFAEAVSRIRERAVLGKIVLQGF